MNKDLIIYEQYFGTPLAVNSELAYSPYIQWIFSRLLLVQIDDKCTLNYGFDPTNIIWGIFRQGHKIHE